MTDSLRTRLSAIEPATLRGIARGLEKESLRATADGNLSMRPHPRALGAPLTHPRITTDFSESQVELITGVHEDIEACLAELTEIHQITLADIDGESLWCTSMPCPLPADDQIPIGQYGSSFIGRTKTIYRVGLKHRYGSRMQTISGLHYNFSIPQTLWPLLQQMPGLRLDENPKRARSQGYFGLIRNFRQHSWLLLLLFGASPLVQRSFAVGMPHILKRFGRDALGLPHATSLRMGPLGYQSDAQSRIGASYNCLKSYAESLYDALTQPYPAYEKMGILYEGEYRQLSTSLLQIENEFYGTIRPKQPIRPKERPLAALAARGVEYVEVRLMDLDPFSPIGITAETIRFLDIFLLYCLLSDSPPDSPKITAAQVMIVRVVSELAAVTMLRRAATGCDSSCANPRLPYIRTNSPATIARMDRPPSTKPQPSRSRWTVMNTDAASATTATAAVTHPSAAKFPNSEAAGQNTCWQTTKTASSPTTGQPQVRTNPRARSWISPRDFNARKVAP